MDGRVGGSRVGELNHRVRAYDTRPSTGPPASRRPRYRAGRAGLMGTGGTPAAPGNRYSALHPDRRAARGRCSRGLVETVGAPQPAAPPCGYEAHSQAGRRKGGARLRRRAADGYHGIVDGTPRAHIPRGRCPISRKELQR
jgi:hypothetical protein